MRGFLNSLSTLEGFLNAIIIVMRKHLYIYITVLAILLIGALIWYQYRQNHRPSHKQYNAYHQEMSSLSRSSLQKLMAGAPRWLIFGDDVDVQNSEKYINSENSQEFKIVFNTTDNLSVVLTKYKDYFTKGNWTIISQKQDSNQANIQAKRIPERATIMFESKDSGTEVTIVYYVKIL
jgi:hypothetical protein